MRGWPGLTEASAATSEALTGDGLVAARTGGDHTRASRAQARRESTDDGRQNGSIEEEGGGEGRRRKPGKLFPRGTWRWKRVTGPSGAAPECRGIGEECRRVGALRAVAEAGDDACVGAEFGREAQGRGDVGPAGGADEQAEFARVLS